MKKPIPLTPSLILFWLLMTAAFLVVGAACVRNGQSELPTEQADANRRPADIPAAAPPATDTVTPNPPPPSTESPSREVKPVQPAQPVRVEFKKIDPASAPAEVRAWSESRYHQKGDYYLHHGGKTYLLSAMGEKRTGGYSVAVRQVEISPDGEIVVHVAERFPEPGQMVIQAITYPWELAAIDRTDRKITFKRSVEQKN